MTYIRTKPVPTCPECGAQMTLRRPTPNQHWEPFWGCSQYPHCTGSREVVEVNEDQPFLFQPPTEEYEKR